MERKQFRRMKIIMGEEGHVLEAHAKQMIRSLEKYEIKHPTQAKPRGVANHAAHFPLLCTECGLSYWSRDEYASHIGCKGVPPKQSAGFS